MEVGNVEDMGVGVGEWFGVMVISVVLEWGWSNVGLGLNGGWMCYWFSLCLGW